LGTILRFFCFFLSFAAVTGLAHAAVDPSYLSLDLSGDEDGNHEHHLDVDLALPEGARFYMALGRADNEDDDTVVETRSQLVGIGTDPIKTFSMGGEFEHWGNEDYLESDTMRLSIGLNRPRWSLLLRPQWRKLTLYADPISALCLLYPRFCTDKLKVASHALGIDFSYFSDGPWGLSLGYIRHHYDWDVTKLEQYPGLAAAIFASSTLDLAYGFVDTRTRLGAYYDFPWATFSYRHSRSVSKVDSLVTTVDTFELAKDITAHWRGRLSIGSQHSDGSNSLGFLGTGLTFSW
jgi:hypothetical protein